MPSASLSSLLYENYLRQVFRESVQDNQTSTSWIGDIAWSTTTNQPRGESYSFLQSIGGFKKWEGEITADQLTAWSKSVVPSSYYDALTIPRHEWMFDGGHFGAIKPQLQEFGKAADNHKVKLLSDRLNNGHSETAIDGANFFSTSHSWNGGATQSNLVSVNLNNLPASLRGATTNPSAEEAGRALMLAARTLVALKGTRGEPQIIPSARFIAMVPMHYVEPFAEAVGQTTYSYGVGNPIPMLSKAGLNFTFQVVANPVLDATSFAASWCLLRADSAMKPLILQTLTPDGLSEPKMSTLAEGTDHWVKNNNALVVATWEGATANWAWHNALKMTFTRS